MLIGRLRSNPGRAVLAGLLALVLLTALAAAFAMGGPTGPGDGDPGPSPGQDELVATIGPWVVEQANHLLEAGSMDEWKEPSFRRPPCDRLTLLKLEDPLTRETFEAACDQLYKIQVEYEPVCEPDGSCEVPLSASAELQGVIHLVNEFNAAAQGEDNPASAPGAGDDPNA